MYNILICDDEQDIVNALKIYLANPDYHLLEAHTGQEALDALERKDIHLVLLDIMMPEMDGYELAVKIRETYDFPIIFLSAKNQDHDKILGLNLGADDYMTKPFNPLEIIARINSNLRRAYQLGYEIKDVSSQLQNGGLILDMDAMTVKKDGENVFLTPTEFKILALLMKNPGRVFTKAQIYQSINGDFYESDENSIIVHISKIRDKLGDDSKNPEFIKNIRGLGYKIEKK